MANSYTWDCKTQDCYVSKDGNSDVVYNVHWILTATSDQKDSEGNFYVSSVYGTQEIKTDSISSFIPYADLTNTKVKNWTTSAMGTDEVNSLKASLDANIAEQITPTLETKTLS
tara:strand:+ start:1078 stop:1419 length:342 start_codon:yes stop_codon:yes gene_type:complete